ncbi:MAG: UbiA family prenyltransferase [Kiritimatiellae bacterium]|nr:UbiA family prenyltransferase [Kiritimatiellia bacterium]
MSDATTPSVSRAWLALCRVPNLLTVPGEPVAGFLLASAPDAQQLSLHALLLVVGCSLCLYLFGLVLNDVMDVEEDRRDRPDRPIPSGAISIHQARIFAVLVGLLGLNLATLLNRPTLFAAVALATLIFLYDAFLKRVPVIGVLAMGLCRGGSFLLGILAANPRFYHLESTDISPLIPVSLAFLAVTLYVTGFSQVAKHETEVDAKRTRFRQFPFVALVITLPAFAWFSIQARHLPSFVTPLLCFFAVISLMRAWFLGSVFYFIQPVPETVGGHIRNLLLLQATLCLGAGVNGILPAVTFLLLSVAFKRLSRRFYSS